MGLFWYDRYKAIAEALLNLSISILLVLHFGIVGIFIGTFCSTVLTSVWVEPYIIYKYRLKRSVSEFFKTYAYYMLVMAGVWTIAECCCRITSGSPLFLLVYRFCICLLLVNLLLWAVYRRTDNWKRTEALLYKVFQNIGKKVRKK